MDMRGHNSAAVAGNWIALSRDTATHWLVGFGQPVKPANPERGAHSRGEAWIDLIMLARWKSGVELNKGRKVPLGVGQLQGGYSFLALRWNWTMKQVRLFLDKLVAEHMVEKGQPLSTPQNSSATIEAPKKGKQQGNQIQVLTLCNYRKYQVAAELMDLMEGQARGKQGASEGQHLNTVTLKQETTLSAGAKFERSNENVVRLQNQLLDACNGAADPANAPGLLSMGEPIRWIESGCDLELDIVPTIKARAHKAPPRSIRSWTYFTQAVADAKAKRMAPMPAGNVRPAQGGAESLDAMIARHRRHYGSADIS